MIRLLHALGFHHWRYGPEGDPYEWERTCTMCRKTQHFIPNTSWFSGDGWWV
jgi:hypothetical protein